MSASKTVPRAVGAVLDLAPRRGEVTLMRLVEAIADNQARPIEVTVTELPPGVCGQWRQYRDRDVFLMREASGLSYDEIAVACELTPMAVRSSLHRARQHLRLSLTPALGRRF